MADTSIFFLHAIATEAQKPNEINCKLYSTGTHIWNLQYRWFFAT